MSAPSERATARDTGQKFYFTGQPCKHGHVAEREVVSGACVVCRRNRGFVHDGERRRKRRVVMTVSAEQEGGEDTVSRVAAEGTDLASDAFAWIDEQATRLGVKPDFIIAGIRNRWSLIEIEQLAVENAQHLADPISEHLDGSGFTRHEDFSIPNEDLR